MATASVKKETQLVLTKCSNATVGVQHRLWLESISSTKVCLPPNTFLGRGGPGNFKGCQTDDLPEEEKLKAWQYTRITNYEADVPKYANGGFVFVAADAKANAEVKVKTLQAIEKEVGSIGFRVCGHVVTRNAHQAQITSGTSQVYWLPMERATEAVLSGEEFDRNSLCTWLRSVERVVKKRIECVGLVRPAFEVALVEHTLGPSNKTSANPLCIFTNKRLELKPKELVALH